MFGYTLQATGCATFSLPQQLQASASLHSPSYPQITLKINPDTCNFVSFYCLLHFTKIAVISIIVYVVLQQVVINLLFIYIATIYWEIIELKFANCFKTLKI